MSTAANPIPDKPSLRDGDRIDRAIGRMDDVLRPEEDAVAPHQETHGGIKFGSGFFGWVTATGMVVLFATLAGIAGLVAGLSHDVTLNDAEHSGPIVLAAAITVAVVVLFGYLCGGYVAGRMARFDGGRQGVGVWLWAVAIALAVAAAALITDNRFGLLDRLKSLPRPAVDHGTLLSGGIALSGAVLVASLIGAVLGGLAGMRFHRRVDRTELDQASR